MGDRWSVSAFVILGFVLIQHADRIASLAYRQPGRRSVLGVYNRDRWKRKKADSPSKIDLEEARAAAL
jgi:hypothetical protein